MLRKLWEIWPFGWTRDGIAQTRLRLNTEPVGKSRRPNTERRAHRERMETGQRPKSPILTIGILAGRPIELAAAQEMEMEMIDRLTAVRAVIDDDAVTRLQSQLSGEITDDHP